MKQTTGGTIMTMPQAYTTPLKKRADIAAYLLNRRGRHYRDYGHLLFTFNVKVYDPDLDFDHLLDLYRKNGYGEDKINDPGWIDEARQRHTETDQDDLYQWAIKDAGRLVTDSDCFNHLSDGTPVEVEYAFVGRSGGWIALTTFEGIKLTDSEYLQGIFERNQEDGETPTMTYEELRRLYALVRMLEHDLTPEKAQAEVEHQASFNFFSNLCADIPTAKASRGAGI
jgi:hypothetical protein